MHRLLISSLITAATLQTAEKERVWTPEVMIQTKTISDVQLSPDNQSVLFVATEPKMDEERGLLISRIYKASAKNKESAIPFTTKEASSSQPRWSPDGNWFAFVSNRQGVKQLYLISSEGGEATQLTNGEKDVQTFSWAPNGRYIAFVREDQIHQEKPVKRSLAYSYKEESSINRLWLLDLFLDQMPKALTPDGFCVRGNHDFGTTNTEFDWSPDSQQITFAYSPSSSCDDLYLDSSLATIHVINKEVVPLEKKALFEGMPRYSPDGEWIAYLSSRSLQRYSMDRRVAIRPAKGGEERLLAETFNAGPFLTGPNLLGWTNDGKNLLFFEPKRTKFHLVFLPADGGAAREVLSEDLFFKEPSLSYDRTMLGLVVQTPATPPEAYIASLEPFCAIQISTLNESLLSYPKTHTEVVSWVSQDATLIEGLLTYPIHYDKTKKYPLLLIIHGGPMSFFDESFLGAPWLYPLAAFAQADFFIFRPNPRGSCGYGKPFRCANYNDWAGGDFLDIMTGVDAMIDKGIIEEEQLGVMGGSYGGYMTAWTITQTARFKAASMGSGICNLVSLNGTTDLHRFLTDYLGSFTDNRKLYEERSPINHAFKVKTPCLIQHGSADLRTPLSQAYEFYHALKRNGQEPEFVIYPGMGHRISDPKMLLDAMERNLKWFESYINP
jgi:dipeptidyl aminopeptidase/acylaminoacyl peptidase